MGVGGLRLSRVLCMSYIRLRNSHVQGGGQPATVQLIFDEDTTLEQLDLAGATDSTQSRSVCLLTEFRESFLIYDPADSRTLTVPRDAVLSVVDAQTTTAALDCTPPNAP